MFKRITEAQVSRAIVGEFTRWFTDYIVSDVVIIGAGPSGLIAGRELARDGFKTLIVESNNYIGGGFWIGGYLMNPLTFRAPAQEILNELKIPYREVEEGLFVADGPNACSKLISAACDAGVRILNMTKFDDLVLRNNRVEGVVINWTPVSALPRAITCVDPISLESKLVIDATGHDAWVCKSLEKRKLLSMETFGPMDINVSEDAVVEKSGEVYPGLLACGMAVSTVFGLPRMGPTFGSMFYSGRKVAEKAKELLSKQSALAKESVTPDFAVS
jgi:thiamine thiazole synthase